MRVQTVAESLLFSTVRVETDTAEGIGTGSAFIFSYSQNEQEYLFLVTNKHVVEKSGSGRFFFTKREGDQPLIGQRFDIHIDNFSNQWHGHPDTDVDIAIMPLVPILRLIGEAGGEVYFTKIKDELIPTAEQNSKLDALEEVVFIGYPNGMYDSTNLMPIWRRGITASHIQVDYDGQPEFLIDASVFPGSSGSPVLILNTGSYSSRGTVVIGSRIHFLGVLSGVFFREEEGQVSIHVGQLPKFKTQQMIDIGIVFKAFTVRETVIDFLKVNGHL